MFPLHENQDKSVPESFPSNLIVDGKWKCIFLNIIVNKFMATSVFNNDRYIMDKTKCRQYQNVLT